MPGYRRTRSVLAATLAGAALVLTACSSTADSSAQTPTASETADAAPTATATVVATPTPTEVVDPTCDTIITEATVAAFADAGWSAREDPFYIVDTELDGGLMCTWGDFSVASDHVQVFGWAPISETDAATARSDLIAQGWDPIDDADGDYITADPSTVVSTDDEGYGMTYLFGDGWVTVADTKQGLVLIEWPPAG